MSELNETHKIGDRVIMSNSTLKGVVGHIAEIRHGAYNTARAKGQTHASALSSMHTMFSESDELQESEEVNELSITALSNFKAAAVSAAEKLSKQGNTSKNPANSYKKFRKAMKHLAGAKDAETKIHKKKWADLTGT